MESTNRKQTKQVKKITHSRTISPLPNIQCISTMIESKNENRNEISNWIHIENIDIVKGHPISNSNRHRVTSRG